MSTEEQKRIARQAEAREKIEAAHAALQEARLAWEEARAAALKEARVAWEEEREAALQEADPWAEERKAWMEAWRETEIQEPEEPAPGG